MKHTFKIAIPSITDFEELKKSFTTSSNIYKLLQKSQHPLCLSSY